MGNRMSDIDSLYPPFAEMVSKHIKKIEYEKLHAYLFESYRSFERQLELYSQGRNKDPNGIWNIVDKKKVVTNALPGKSWHAYGLAVDYAFDGNIHKEGIQWTWEDADLTKAGIQPLPWKRLGELGVECDLEWAGNWKSFREYPHFQHLFGFSRTDLYPILVSSGIEAVWKKLDTKVKPSSNKIFLSSPVVKEEVVIKKTNFDNMYNLKELLNNNNNMPDKTVVK